MTSRTAIIAALCSAVLFGASTPFAKLLAGDVPPMLLAGLLYLGSGLGLWIFRLASHRRAGRQQLPRGDWGWFAGAIASGGIVAPVLLMVGLQQTSASSASLLLNLEAVFTAMIAWMVFRENVDRRLVIGMMLIVAGGAVLAWPQSAGVLGAPGGPLGGALGGTICIAAACLCWAVDNNLTRRVSAADADFIAGTKGLVAGGTNIALATALGAHLPLPLVIASAMLVGLLGYGLSLVLFVIALRGLGSARAGAYFSTAPFLGAVIAILVLHDPTPPAFLLSVCLMAVGVALHLMERHSHVHSHEAQGHSHAHSHDAHHRHEHDFPWNGTESHVHAHHHEPLTHEHAHFPELHHRHGH